MVNASLVLLLTIHLLANALAAGAPMAAALLPVASSARKKMVGLGLVALAVGLLSGGLSVLIVVAGGRPEYAAAAARLPGQAYLMLGGELAFSATLLVVYYWLWDRLGRRRFWHGLIGFVAATNLLYHFPTMMVVLRLLAEQPSLAAESVVDRRVFLGIMREPLPRGLTLHFWSLCALATGLVLRRVTAGGARVGALVALAGVIGLFLSGLWCLLSLPASSVRGLMSMKEVSGWLFLGGVGCGLLLLSRLSSEACGPSVQTSLSVQSTRRLAARDGLLHLTVAAVVLMAAASRLV